MRYGPLPAFVELVYELGSALDQLEVAAAGQAGKGP